MYRITVHDFNFIITGENKTESYMVNDDEYTYSKALSALPNFPTDIASRGSGMDPQNRGRVPASNCRNSKSIRVAYGIVKQPWLHDKTCSRSSTCSTLLLDEPQRMETTYCYNRVPIYDFSIGESTLVSEFRFNRRVCVKRV